MCGLPGYGPGRPDRPVVRGRHRHRHRGRRHAPPAAADHARRPRRCWWRCARWPTCPGVVDTAAVRRATGEDRAGGRGRGHDGGRRRRAARGEEEATTAAVQRGAGRRAGRCASATTPRAATPSPQRTVDPMRLLHRRGPRLPGGVVPPRGGGAPVPAGPRGATSRCSTSPPPPPPEAEPTDLSAGLFQPAPRAPQRRAVLEPDARWVAEYYPVDEIDRTSTRPTARSGSSCATPTRRGWCGWCWGWAGQRGWSSRPSWPRRWRERARAGAGPSRRERRRNEGERRWTRVVGGVVAFAVVLACCSCWRSCTCAGWLGAWRCCGGIGPGRRLGRSRGRPSRRGSRAAAAPPGGAASRPEEPRRRPVATNHRPCRPARQTTKRSRRHGSDASAAGRWLIIWWCSCCSSAPSGCPTWRGPSASPPACSRVR